MSDKLDRIRRNSERAERTIEQTDAAVNKFGRNDGASTQARKFERMSRVIEAAAARSRRSVEALGGALRTLGGMTARPKIELRGAAEALRQIAAVRAAMLGLRGASGGGIPPPTAGFSGMSGGGRGRMSFGPFSMPVRGSLIGAGIATGGAVLGTGLGALGGMAGAGIGALGPGLGAGMAGMAGLMGGGAATALGMKPVVQQAGMAAKAIEAYRTEAKAAGGDLERLAAAQRKMEEALKGTPQRTRQAARNILALKERYKEAFAEGRRFAQSMGLVERATGFAAGRGIDMLTQSFDRFFPVFDRAAKSVMDFFESEKGTREFRQWTEGLPGVADNMLKIGGAAARMFGGIIRGFTPLATRMTGGLANWFGKAADWANSARGMERMERLGAAALPIFRSLGGFVIALGRGMGVLLEGNSGRALSNLLDRMANGMPGFVGWLDRAAAHTPRFIDLMSDIGQTLGTLFGPNTAFDIGIRMLNNFAASIRVVTDALGGVGGALMAAGGIATLGRLIGGARSPVARTAGGALLGGTLMGPLGAIAGGAAFSRLTRFGGGGAAGVGGMGGGGMGGMGPAASGVGAEAAPLRAMQNLMAQSAGGGMAKAMLMPLGMAAAGMMAPGLAGGLSKGLGAAAKVLGSPAAMIAAQYDNMGKRAGVGRSAALRFGATQWIQSQFGRAGTGGYFAKLFGRNTAAQQRAMLSTQAQMLAQEGGGGRVAQAKAIAAAQRGTGMNLWGATKAGLSAVNPFRGGVAGFGRAGLRFLGGPVGAALTLGTIGLGAYSYLNRDQGGGLPEGSILDDPERLRAERFRGTAYREIDAPTYTRGTEKAAPFSQQTRAGPTPDWIRREYVAPNRFIGEESRLKKDTQARAEQARDIQRSYRGITRELERQRRLQKSGKDEEGAINTLLSERRALVQQLASSSPTAVTYGQFGAPTGINQPALSRLTLGLEAGTRTTPGGVAARFGQLTRGRRISGAAERNLMSTLTREAPGMDLNAVSQAARSGDLRSLEILRRQAGAFGGEKAELAFVHFQRAIQRAGGTYGNFIARLRDLAPMWEKHMVQPARRAARRISDKELDAIIKSDGGQKRDTPRWLRRLVGDAKEQPELRGIARRSARVFINGVVDNLKLTPKQELEAKRALRKALGLTPSGRVPRAPRDRDGDDTPTTAPVTDAQSTGGYDVGRVSKNARRAATAATRELNRGAHQKAAREGGHRVGRKFADGVWERRNEAQKNAKEVITGATRGLRDKDKVANAEGSGRHVSNQFAKGVESGGNKAAQAAKRVVDRATGALDDGDRSTPPSSPSNPRSKDNQGDAPGPLAGTGAGRAFAAGSRVGEWLYKKAEARGVSLHAGGGYAGSQGVVESFIPLAGRFGSQAGSRKRETKYTASGGISDHWVGNKNAYAIDFPIAGARGDQMAAAVGRSLGTNWAGGSWLNVTKGGYRVQAGWKVPGHYDHIHIGASKAGDAPGPNAGSGGRGSIGLATMPKLAANSTRSGGVTIQINGNINVRNEAEYEAFVERLGKDLELALVNTPMDPDVA